MVEEVAQRPDLVGSLRGAVRLYHAETEHHLRRVHSIATLLGVDAAIPASELPAVRCAALLHDFGKLAIDRDVLEHPGPLTDDQWRDVKRHSEIGAEVVGQLAGPLDPTVAVIRSHHERWDGSGYPDGLGADAIPLGARIIAIADTLDAITQRRAYTPRVLAFDEALDEIARCSGTQFDPELVTLFLEHVERSPGDVQRAMTGDTEHGR